MKLPLAVILAVIVLQCWRFELERKPAPEHVVVQECGGIEQVHELNVRGGSASARCKDWRLMAVIDRRGIYGY